MEESLTAWTKFLSEDVAEYAQGGLAWCVLRSFLHGRKRGKTEKLIIDYLLE